MLIPLFVRVYGYRAEGVVFIILAFFAFGWAMVFTVAIIMGYFRNRRGPRQVSDNGDLNIELEEGGHYKDVSPMPLNLK